MISNINDISYFLEALSRFRTKNGIRKKILYPFIKIPSSLLIYPFNHDEIFKFCLDLNLLQERNRTVRLTHHGSNLVDMKGVGIDLTNEQITYIVQNCIFDNEKFSSMKNLFTSFIFYEKFGTYVISDEKTIRYRNIIAILSQFNVVHKRSQLWLVNKNYVEYIEQIKHGIPKPLTQKQLDVIILEQKRIGELAEELTVQYEIQRLKQQKLFVESKHVKKISNEYVNKGYDIESFSGKSKESDLFIEVKGRKYNTSSFIISINEIKTAEVLGNRYAIYFWNGLGSTKQPEKPFKIIHNPFKKLSFNKCKNCITFLIEVLD